MVVGGFDRSVGGAGGVMGENLAPPPSQQPREPAELGPDSAAVHQAMASSIRSADGSDEEHV
jgi:hypothetical protein